MQFINFMFSGFLAFVGSYCLITAILYFVCNTVSRIWTRLTRCIMVSIHGWPPSHLDADGDFKEPEKQTP